MIRDLPGQYREDAQPGGAIGALPPDIMHAQTISHGNTRLENIRERIQEAIQGVTDCNAALEQIADRLEGGTPPPEKGPGEKKYQSSGMLGEIFELLDYLDNEVLALGARVNRFLTL